MRRRGDDSTSALYAGGAGEPLRLLGLNVSTFILSTLGVRPALGRYFLPNEPGDRIILSDLLWRSRFAADPSAIGRVFIPTPVKRYDVSAGAGTAYLHYSETVPQNRFYQKQLLLLHVARRPGCYGLANVSYFLDSQPQFPCRHHA
jgi:hypothetical protein